jgi:serine/threonine protein kinase
MDREHWDEIKQIVHACLELEPGQREARVTALCSGNLELQAEVESLLASSAQVGDFLETPVWGEAPGESGDHEDLLTGRQIGQYQLGQVIARGGMGTVYRAVRVSDFQQRVAIKLVKRGMDTDFILRRFRHERQILAGLDHPNIARLLDGGATDDGRPYLVMEYIDGTPITDHAEQSGLTVPERLELFRTVCSAVQYAHQNLVVHRDLKPSNILVTASGVPKLLDFGIAKLLDPDADATVTSVWLMTPECASPEQVRGQPITTATDIYSLGVLLYHLLTGERPYEFTTRTPEEVMRVVCETDPKRPGAIRPLSEDLDTVVLKTMHKDPARRYLSAEQLAEDIRRCLRGLPVSARKDTVAYRSRRFVSRHKAGVAVAALVLVAVIAGIVTISREAGIARLERNKAEARFEDVRKLANSLVFELHDAIQDLPGATRARELLVKRASEYLDRLSVSASGNTSLQDELASAYEKVGDIQANTGSESVGNTKGALDSYRKALQIRETLAAAGPSPRTRSYVALLSSKLGSALETEGDFSAAIESDRRAVEIAEQLYRSDPAPNSNRLAVLAVRMGFHQFMKGDWVDSRKMYDKGIQVLEAARASHIGGRATEQNLAFAYKKLGKLALKQSMWDEALASYQKALVATTAELASQSESARGQLDLAYCYLGIGDSLAGKGDHSAALGHYRKAEQIASRAVKADPNDMRAATGLGDSYVALGQALTGTGDPRAGLRYLQESVNAFERVHAADPLQADIQKSVGESSAALADVCVTLALRPGTSKAQQAAFWHRAESAYEQALESFSALRARGALASDAAAEPERVEKALARCRAALASLA